MALFTVGETSTHDIGNPHCAECLESYPEPCPCGGLMHAASGGEEDADGNVLVVTQCDRCGRDEDDLDRV
jgi:hypothetical protein